MQEKIKAWVEEREQEIKAMYHYLHENGEISWEEKKATDFICKQLDSLEIPYERFADQTGVIGLWGKSDGPVIGLRTDMDALWQNVNGEWKANHSCGHDAHMTILLFTLKCLKELGVKPTGTIKSIFQPAEETGDGALSLIQKGVMDDIDYLIGLHLRPIQEMPFGKASPAIYHGAAAILKGKIYGVQAHGARHHLGVNVIDSLTAINAAIRSIPVNPVIPATVKMTFAQAGGKNYNIIPDYAEFGVDVRAQTNEAMEDLLEKVNRSIQSAGEANGAKVEVERISGMVAAQPNEFMEEVVGDSIKEMLGPENIVLPPVTPGGEDFHFYPQKNQQLQATMIGLGTDLLPGLHHPEMTFQLDSLLNGIKIMAMATLKLVNK
ncbi:M20 peptidase aminoacylase family protein [Niallia sp. 01092]|uniref:M20 peptidase aminoacylase family protein n=1 Tax=unclassified Niallia TaxID=2837522 RepID=UPI003FD551AC